MAVPRVIVSGIEIWPDTWEELVALIDHLSGRVEPGGQYYDFTNLTDVDRDLIARGA